MRYKFLTIPSWKRTSHSFFRSESKYANALLTYLHEPEHSRAQRMHEID